MKANQSSLLIESSAVFSPCKAYRYSLSRTWDRSLVSVLFIGLNPSTADETIDDPTIRRCIGFAKKWKFGGMEMANLFAFRSTDPKNLKTVSDPVGPENDKHIKQLDRESHLTIAAWGCHGSYLDRDEDINKMIKPLHCLGLTKGGYPKHPLYLSKNLKPVLF